MTLICGISKDIIALRAARIPEINLKRMKNNVLKYRKAPQKHAGQPQAKSGNEYMEHGHKAIWGIILCWKKEVPSTSSIFGATNMDLPLKRAVRKPKPLLGQLLLNGEGGLLVLGIWESSCGITEEFRLEGTSGGYLAPTTAQTEALPGQTRLLWGLPTQVLILLIPVPAWALSQCWLSVHPSGTVLAAGCAWGSWWEQPHLPGPGSFSSGQTQLPEWLRPCCSL